MQDSTPPVYGAEPSAGVRGVMGRHNGNGLQERRQLGQVGGMVAGYGSGASIPLYLDRSLWFFQRKCIKYVANINARSCFGSQDLYAKMSQEVLCLFFNISI